KAASGRRKAEGQRAGGRFLGWGSAKGRDRSSRNRDGSALGGASGRVLGRLGAPGLFDATLWLGRGCPIGLGFVRRNGPPPGRQVHLVERTFEGPWGVPRSASMAPNLRSASRARALARSSRRFGPGILRSVRRSSGL